MYDPHSCRHLYRAVQESIDKTPRQPRLGSLIRHHDVGDQRIDVQVGNGVGQTCVFIGNRQCVDDVGIEFGHAQRVGLRQVETNTWLVTFMNVDLAYLDLMNRTLVAVTEGAT